MKSLKLSISLLLLVGMVEDSFASIVYREVPAKEELQKAVGLADKLVTTSEKPEWFLQELIEGGYNSVDTRKILDQVQPIVQAVKVLSAQVKKAQSAELIETERTEAYSKSEHAKRIQLSKEKKILAEELEALEAETVQLREELQAAQVETAQVRDELQAAQSAQEPIAQQPVKTLPIGPPVKGKKLDSSKNEQLRQFYNTLLEGSKVFIKGIPAIVFSEFSLNQIKNIPPDRFKILKKSQLEALSATQVQVLSKAQLKELKSKKLDVIKGKLSAAQKGTLVQGDPLNAAPAELEGALAVVPAELKVAFALAQENYSKFNSKVNSLRKKRHRSKKQRRALSRYSKSRDKYRNEVSSIENEIKKICPSCTIN